jgi:hypothetical protein
MWKLKRGWEPVRRDRGDKERKEETECASEWTKRRLELAVDALQALVLDTKSRRGILNCSRQWGKSTVTAAKAIHHAVHVPESLTLVVSPSGRQSAEFLRKVDRFARKLGQPVKGDGDNELSLALPNGSRIVGLPGNEATVRGFSAVSLLLADEASRVTDELYLAIRPMLAVSHGALWLMSTPFGKRGFFYEVWMHGGPEWERVRAPATECPRIPAEFLREERAAMGERYFRQEYLCEFVDSVSGMFDRDLMDGAVREDVRPLEIGLGFNAETRSRGGKRGEHIFTAETQRR